MDTSQFWLNNINMTVFSERLKSLREERGLTQTRLAELLVADPRVYNRWERGTATPQLDTVVKIALILQVSIDELAGIKEPVSVPLVHNPKLRTLLNDVDSLTDEDQQALIILMDSLLKRSKINRVMAA